MILLVGQLNPSLNPSLNPNPNLTTLTPTPYIMLLWL
jgi:hypothetical protein